MAIWIDFSSFIRELLIVYYSLSKLEVKQSRARNIIYKL